MKLLIASLLIAGLSHFSAEPLVTYQTDRALSSMKILGTSTLHDWEIKAEDLMGTMKVDIYADSLDIQDLRLSVPVKSLKSGKAPMDANTHKALKAKDHPTIVYKLQQVLEWKKKGPSQYLITTRGQLTVAGQTKSLRIPIEARVLDEGLELSGSTSFKMTEFEVEPPSFMFGSVSTGDKITIQFNINYH